VENQSGFRRHHSCESVIQSVVNSWYVAMDRGDVVLAVFLDLRRAFETINRSLLIKKMIKMGITGNVINWFSSYLTNRKQVVSFKNTTSSEQIVDNGVPQGTILGPILFLIYINDLCKIINKCEIQLFADDTMLYISGKDIKKMMLIMNLELENVNVWLRNNYLCINTEKSKFIIFRNQKNINKINSCEINIKINNISLQNVENIKYLGVMIDKNLDFKNHIKYIQNKMSKKVFFLIRAGKHLSTYAKLLIYKTIIIPQIDYCATLLLSIPKYMIQELQIIQNRAMRIILKCNRYTPITLMLNNLSEFSVHQKILYKSVEFIYKIRNKMLPQYLQKNLTFVRDIHQHNTRNRENYAVQTFNSTNKNNTLFAKGIKIFNDLPNDLKNCKHFKQFKILLRLYILEQYIYT